MTGNREHDFIDRIDCNFPYHKPRQAYGVIEEALAISDLAVFTVLEELCRLPFREMRNNATRRKAWKYLNYLTARFEHPAKDTLANVAKRMLKREPLSVNEAMQKIKELKPYKLFPALSILQDACDDIDGKVELLCDAIYAEWYEKSA